MTDIAELNLKLARGLPGSEDLDVEQCLARLDTWSRLVAAKTDRCLPMFPSLAGGVRRFPAKFRMMALVTVLQRDLGVRYDPACQEGPYCALDPRTLFIHGLLDGQGGTCVTMPVLYVAIGRRLGYPLHLVHAREHFFVRWEEPRGERFNIEATTLGFTPRDDDHYRHWPKPIRDEEIRQGLVSAEPHPARGACGLPPRARAVLAGPPADRGSPGSLCGSRATGPSVAGHPVRLAIASILDRAVKYSERDALLATAATDIQLPPTGQRWESQVRPLAREQLQRIVGNYRERISTSAPTAGAVVCQARKRR